MRRLAEIEKVKRRQYTGHIKIATNVVRFVVGTVFFRELGINRGITGLDQKVGDPFEPAPFVIAISRLIINVKKYLIERPFFEPTAKGRSASWRPS